MNIGVETKLGEKASPLKGKPLSEIDKAKNDAMGGASTVGRQLAYAGIATVWLLRNDGQAAPLSNVLLFALLFLSAALLADFLQYVHCSRVWKKFYNEQFNIHGSDDALVDIPPSLTASMYKFFWAKFSLLLSGSSLLIIGAAKKLVF